MFLNKLLSFFEKIGDGYRTADIGKVTRFLIVIKKTSNNNIYSANDGGSVHVRLLCNYVMLNADVVSKPRKMFLRDFVAGCLFVLR